MSNLKDVKDKVEYCLLNYPHTRECDIELVKAVWKRFYSGSLSMDGKSIPLENLKSVPTHESIKRIRAWFNSDDNGRKERQYLPISQKVLKTRKILEEETNKETLDFSKPYKNPFIVEKVVEEEDGAAKLF